MGLKTCVYCNAIPTMSNNGEVFYQMDHYLPQSLYPFLGTCFYNLQPSCGVCNDHKKTKNCDFGLYVNSEQHKDLSPFRFVPKIESLDGPYPRCEEIQFRGKEANVTKESKAHEEMFHINNMYAGYKDEVSALYTDAYKMNPSMVEVNAAWLGNSCNQKGCVGLYVWSFILGREGYSQKTLTKLKQDTIKQLKEGGVL